MRRHSMFSFPSLAEARACVAGDYDTYFSLQAQRKSGVNVDAFADCFTGDIRASECGDPERAAAHEVGHALVWFVVWARHDHLPHRICIRPDGSGAVEGDNPPGATAIQSIAVTLAGPIAGSVYQFERRSFDPFYRLRDSGETDDLELESRRLGRQLHTDEIEAGRSLANRILRDNHEALNVGRRYLVAERDMTGAQLKAAIWPFVCI